MLICKSCLSRIIEVNDDDVLKYYWVYSLQNYKCDKCSKIRLEIDFISDKEMEYIQKDKGYRIAKIQEERYAKRQNSRVNG